MVGPTQFISSKGWWSPMTYRNLVCCTHVSGPNNVLAASDTGAVMGLTKWSTCLRRKIFPPCWSKHTNLPHILASNFQSFLTHFYWKHYCTDTCRFLSQFVQAHLYSERARGAGFRWVNPAERWRENPARAEGVAGFSQDLECGIHQSESSPAGCFALIPRPVGRWAKNTP